MRQLLLCLLGLVIMSTGCTSTDQPSDTIYTSASPAEHRDTLMSKNLWVQQYPEFETITRVTDYVGITQVFMHAPHHYSIMVPVSPSSKENKIFEVWSQEIEDLFVMDVPDSMPMWARKVIGRSRTSKMRVPHLEFHLHRPQDIQGGEWNHGKFGKGTTIPLVR